MNMTILDATKALGAAVVESDEYKNMQTTEKTAMSDPAVSQMMAQYLEIKEQLDEAMNGRRDPEEIAKIGSEMDKLRESLNMMPQVMAMTDARRKFSQMMDQVNQILQFTITGEVANSCTGDCGTCGGCH